MSLNENDELHDQTSLSVNLLHGKIKESTLETWRCTGQGPRFIRVGRKVLYRRRDVETWLESRTVSHTQQTLPAPKRCARRQRGDQDSAA